MKILFICTGNTCRSPMAEGILKFMIEKNNLNIEVESAGISVFHGDNASKNSIEAMKKIGIDISRHRAKQIHGELVNDARLILTMSKSHKDFIILNFPRSRDKVFTLLEYAYKLDKDVVDPFGGRLTVYENTRDEIYRAIEKIINSGQLTKNN
ncbi:protein-tyrosine phosphatase [Tissierella praeacuta DSM 18095]|uniref:Protein-tyrosine phosphatase n=1 Tax=Tissierella praeacuta DSM 18095 TaxID=1123404 RepID=A0A1M4WHR1_9FIRM|nr:low molecular weight protein arginine phosphatase [Tissierella praeacuta]TCU79069.1 protein-tyrosine phosphatase [Tissierella praeacuta]SHE80735.1 protein-tyrosine phosphatase [Tissierella praeacuta DSM 18095]SUO99419.1 Low molecular weight protein-tyrosine-phosphatase ywlE [Tissierella praeacuta]HAE92070.1 low molecular weight protein arginine phosphatase [Tissierella sp.]